MRIPRHLVTERIGRQAIDGWKAIAEVLGVSDKTAQKYSEMDNPLPVTRTPTGRVWIYVDELVEWAVSNGIG